MGMGYGACWADTISEENLATIGHVKERLRMLHSILEEYGVTMDELGRAYNFSEELDGVDQHGNDRINTQYTLIQQEFERETGLRVYLSHHDSEVHGSRYDDVDGTFWWVAGMRQYTPEGEKIAEIVARSTWVEFG
jgi:hypothetical protein